MKPLITYEHISEGENKGKVQVLADGKEIKVIPYAGNGFVSSWQENTFYAVQDIAKELYPSGFDLPYYVGQDGYVWRENLVNNVK